MPAQTSPASDTARAIAPDGIAIHPFSLPSGAFVGVAEGRIPSGRYSVHRHLSLEQYTYLIAGHLTVITGTETGPEGHAAEAGPGDLLLTLPGESLEFVNNHPRTARVLFICAPPYPVDDGDTRTLDAHGPPRPHEHAEMRTRLEAIRTAFNATIDARLASLT